MRVDLREVESACDQEDHGTNGREPAITAGLALGGLEEAIQGFQEAIGGPRLRPGTEMPSRWERTRRATAFMGSTLERLTFVHHGFNIRRTTFTCLRFRISRSCSRYTRT